MGGFQIPSGLINTYQYFVDGIIDNLGYNITLVYPPKQMSCTMCKSDGVGNKPGSKHTSGMPIPTNYATNCAHCGGTGLVTSAASEVIKGNVYFTPKEWLNVGFNIQVPDGSILTRNYMTDLPKIDMCDYILVHSAIAQFRQYKYQRQGEPVPQGFGQHRYIYCMWSRIGGSL